MSRTTTNFGLTIRDPAPRAGSARGPDRQGPPLWIAWETQRRSLTLSRRLEADLRIFDDEGLGWLRYPFSAAKSMRELLRARGRVLIVQNPSMLLAALAGFWRPWLGYTLVVDRHSNFRFGDAADAGFRRRLAQRLSAYTLRRADLTIVTNSELAQRVEMEGGRAFVLPDPFPDLRRSAAPEPRSPFEILFVSTWAPDEPVAEVMEMCRRMGREVHVRITGRMKPGFKALMQRSPPNFEPTGFLPDGEYFRLMAESHCVLAVTTRPATLVCGAYEAIAMGRPLVLGDSRALREYFSAGAVYTDCRVEDLIRKVRLLRDGYAEFARQIQELRSTRSREWDARLEELRRRLGLAPAGGAPAGK